MTSCFLPAGRWSPDVIGMDWVAWWAFDGESCWRRDIGDRGRKTAPENDVAIAEGITTFRRRRGRRAVAGITDRKMEQEGKAMYQLEAWKRALQLQKTSCYDKMYPRMINGYTRRNRTILLLLKM